MRLLTRLRGPPGTGPGVLGYVVLQKHAYLPPCIWTLQKQIDIEASSTRVGVATDLSLISDSCCFAAWLSLLQLLVSSALFFSLVASSLAVGSAFLPALRGPRAAQYLSIFIAVSGQCLLL